MLVPEKRMPPPLKAGQHDDGDDEVDAIITKVGSIQ